MLQAGRSEDRIPMSLDISIDLVHPAALWPWVDSASNRNEYQESSWGVRGCQCIKLTCSSEKSVDFHGNTWHYNPEDRTLHKIICCQTIVGY
jgi:hypothetical protein